MVSFKLNFQCWGHIFQEKRADTLCYSLYLIPHLDYDYYETQDNEKERGRRGGGVTIYLFGSHFVKFT